MATSARHRKITVEEFLEIDFGRLGQRFELEDGVIYAMTGGSPAHARVQGNIYAFLHRHLQGTACRPYGPDMPLRTLAHTTRYPDVTIYCGNPGEAEKCGAKLLPNPVAVIEVLSPSTRSLDEGRKLEEYQSLPSVMTVALVDPEEEWAKVFQRSERGEWDDFLTERSGDLPLPSLCLIVPRAEIFAR